MRKATAAKTGVPSRYTSVSGGQFAKAWQPKVGETLEGVCVGVRTVDAKAVGRRKAKKGEKVVIVDVANSDGEIFAVWESHALREFCQRVKAKDGVFLRLDDVKKIGRKTLKVFSAGIAGKAK